jgi:hypothetical protein
MKSYKEFHEAATNNKLTWKKVQDGFATRMGAKRYKYVTTDGRYEITSGGNTFDRKLSGKQKDTLWWHISDLSKPEHTTKRYWEHPHKTIEKAKAAVQKSHTNELDPLGELVKEYSAKPKAKLQDMYDRYQELDLKKLSDFQLLHYKAIKKVLKIK